MEVNFKLSLSIGFNDGQRFTHDYIKIEGVPIVPIEGQSVRFHWPDFLNDKDLCNKLEEFEDDDMFLVHIGSIEYRKDEVITHIILHEHRDYPKYYGKPQIG